MPKLTKRFVDGLDIRKTDYIVFDSDVGGFAVRVFPSGRKSYLIQYRNDGRTRRLAIGRHGTVATDEARKVALRRLGEVAKGEDPSQARNERLRAPSMAALCERFLSEHVQVHCKPSTMRNYRGMVRNHIKPRLGPLKVTGVNRSDIAAFHHSMRETPYQANRALSALSKMFNLAELWGIRADGSNPCRLVQKFKENPKERYLSHAELARLGQVFAEAVQTGTESPFVVAAYQLLLMTGCRMSEIQTLKWEYVTNTHLLLPDSKTGARRIPFSADAHAVLAALPRTEGNPYVIEGKLPNTHCADLQHAWQRLRRAAGLEDVRIHDLRHTYASMAVTNGIDLLTVGKILGHSNYQTTERYAHLADDAIRRASDQVSGLMAGAITPLRSEPPHARLRIVT